MQKNREFSHLKHFKEICSFFPEGEIECTEKPDFLVHTQDTILGIEHTEIFRPGPTNGTSPQAQESIYQRVVDKASSSYLENHSQPLLVQISFNERIMIGKKDGKSLADAIDRLAKAVVRLLEMAPIVPGNSIIIERTKENSKEFPDEIRRLYVYAYPNGKENRWKSLSPGWIPEITPEDVQEKIDKKEPKLDSYKTKCSELWLLIVAHNVEKSTSIDLSEAAISHYYSTKFDRVFFFWNSTRHYIELQLANINHRL